MRALCVLSGLSLLLSAAALTISIVSFQRGKTAAAPLSATQIEAIDPLLKELVAAGADHANWAKKMAIDDTLKGRNPSAQASGLTRTHKSKV